MGIGMAAGENRAAEAARAAISSPLLESSVEGATGILLNITGGGDLGLFEVNDAAEIVASAADQNANIIFGAVVDEQLGDHIRVTVIATGFETPPALAGAGAAVDGAVAAVARHGRLRPAGRRLRDARRHARRAVLPCATRKRRRVSRRLRAGSCLPD